MAKPKGKHCKICRTIIPIADWNSHKEMEAQQLSIETITGEIK